MRKSFLILTVVLCAVLVCSCTKREADYINVSLEEVEFSSDGGTQTVTVSSNVEWDLKASQNWIKPKKNSSDGTIEIKVLSHTSDDPRESTLVLSGGAVTKNIIIKQNQCNKVFIDGDRSFMLTEADTTIVVKFKSNVDYTISVPETASSWIKVVDPTKALSSSQVSFKVEANPVYDTRSAEILISAPEVSDLKVVITQIGKPRSFAFHVEGVSSYVLPLIMNSSASATIYDGKKTVDFVSGSIVEVSGPTDYQINARGLESVTFTSIIGLTDIDLSTLR